MTERRRSRESYNITSFAKRKRYKLSDLSFSVSGVELVTENDNLYDTTVGVREHIAAFKPLSPSPSQLNNNLPLNYTGVITTICHSAGKWFDGVFGSSSIKSPLRGEAFRVLRERKCQVLGCSLSLICRGRSCQRWDCATRIHEYKWRCPWVNFRGWCGLTAHGEWRESLHYDMSFIILTRSIPPLVGRYQRQSGGLADTEEHMQGMLCLCARRMSKRRAPPTVWLLTWPQVAVQGWSRGG